MDELDVTVALRTHAMLGEGLHWDSRRSLLWMVDILGCRLLRWNLAGPIWQEWQMPECIGWVIPERSGKTVLLGLQGGFARAPADQPDRFNWIARPFEGRSDLRLNDAKADAEGAVWAGSMNHEDESRSDGCLYRFSPDGRLSTVDSGYTVANGPALTRDGRTLLHTDSGRRTIYVFDVDAASGRLTRKRVWKVFAEDEGHPDGMCFDSSGHVWIAHWGAGCISRFSLDGALHRRVRLPAPLITNVCFGGPRLDRLFVSSARVGLTREQLDQYPLSGSLFEVPAGGAIGVASYHAGVPNDAYVN